MCKSELVCNCVCITVCVYVCNCAAGCGKISVEMLGLFLVMVPCCSNSVIGGVLVFRRRWVSYGREEAGL